MEMTRELGKMSDKEKGEKFLSKVEGSWLKQLCFDGEEYWNVGMGDKAV
jgi:hypothetical protein